MSTRHLVDPDLQPFLDVFPALDLSTEALPGIRELMATMAVLGDPAEYDVTRREIKVPGLNGAPDVRCLVYESNKSSGTRPAFLHIHGGGYIGGNVEGSDQRNTQVAAQLGVTVVSVEYRLAPEHPYPAPLDDCAAALAWLFDTAGELNVDAARIAVGGDSAGGGLAAALVQRTHAEGKYTIAFQHLVYPMLDDRTTAPGVTPDPLTGEFVWTADANKFGWASYLGDMAPAAPAVPARADSVEGLPPTWIGVGGLDLFLDEDIAYARRLTGAGVATELQIYPAAYHGFVFVQDAPISQRFERDYLESLGRGLGV